jgi:hypothetical protein
MIIVGSDFCDIIMHDAIYLWHRKLSWARGMAVGFPIDVMYGPKNTV